MKRPWTLYKKITKIKNNHLQPLPLFAIIYENHYQNHYQNLDLNLTLNLVQR